MRDYGLTFKGVSTICLAKNPIQHGKVKHINMRFHFLRDNVEKGDVELIYIDTKNQLADILTKPLDALRHAFLWGKLGVCHPYGII